LARPDLRPAGEDGGCQAAAGSEFAADHAPFGLHGGDDVAQHSVDGVFVENVSSLSDGDTFYENAVNRMLRDIVAAVKPEWCVVRGEFTPRGGLTTSIFARWPEIRPRQERRTK